MVEKKRTSNDAIVCLLKSDKKMMDENLIRFQFARKSASRSVASDDGG